MSAFASPEPITATLTTAWAATIDEPADTAEAGLRAAVSSWFGTHEGSTAPTMAARVIMLPGPGEGGPDVLMRHAVADLEASPADGERHVRMAHLRLTEEQFAQLGARLQALADEYQELSDPSLPDVSLAFALFRPVPREQADGDSK